jgi:hypothetical protein
VKAYEEVVRQLDGQRHLAASAVFRLGECYRKLNRTHDAVAQFQRITREDPDQETLAKLSRQNLVGLGVKDAGAAESHSGRGGKTIPESVRILEAQVEELKQHTIEELPEIIRNWFGAARSLGLNLPETLRRSGRGRQDRGAGRGDPSSAQLLVINYHERRHRSGDAPETGGPSLPGDPHGGAADPGAQELKARLLRAPGVVADPAGRAPATKPVDAAK